MHLNQPDYYDKDIPCFLFISFSFQRSVSPDPALNYDYYHSGRQVDSFPRGSTATDPETIELIWGSADQSGEWRAGRKRMGVQKTNMQMLFMEKTERRLGYTFYHLLLEIRQADELEAAMHYGELCGLFSPEEHGFLITSVFRCHASPSSESFIKLASFCTHEQEHFMSSYAEPSHMREICVLIWITIYDVWNAHLRVHLNVYYILCFCHFNIL